MSEFLNDGQRSCEMIFVLGGDCQPIDTISANKMVRVTKERRRIGWTTTSVKVKRKQIEETKSRDEILHKSQPDDIVSVLIFLPLVIGKN